MERTQIENIGVINLHFADKNTNNHRNKKTPTCLLLAVAMTSSSSADLAGRYDVFLSFRGRDTRKNFTDHLFHNLEDAGIHTFKDSKSLRNGEEIGPGLIKAIKDSKIFIPIFSKNYAESKWCLIELALMVNCLANGRQKILPVFYDVDVSDVKDQGGSYKKAFQQHNKKFPATTVKEWREGLKTVGKLQGYELKIETSGFEGELVKKIVKAIWLQLKKDYIQVPDELVGMDQHIQEMRRLLRIDSNGVVDSNVVRIVGIHGMGGIGKTTIAQVIYNQISESFNRCCFLKNVREKANKHHMGLVNLQKHLISQILKVDLPDIVDVDDGIIRIKDAVRRNKVLIVIDDVDEKFQFDKLCGECNWFDKASRIIVTTRNEKVLKELQGTCMDKGLSEVYESYMPNFLNPDDSLQLFSKYAFKIDSPILDYFILSKKVVSTAAGLPLVLVTLGSLFYHIRDKKFWEEKLKELKNLPDKDVIKKLRISFEALNDYEKHIFLDIACLFDGKDKAKPYYMWDDYDYSPLNGIKTLVLRSLVKVEADKKLWMHDQIRDLGRHIVQEETPHKYSRVWRPEEAWDMLKGDLGTREIEALNLDLRAITEDKYVQLQLEGEVHEQDEFVKRSQLVKTNSQEAYYIRRLVEQDFIHLRSLRFLRVGFAELDGNFMKLLLNLRWLKWRCCGKFLAKNLYLKKLVILDLSYSEITDTWEGWSLFKATKKLKVLNLSGCVGLRRGPNLSMLETLEVLNLRDTDLSDINPSFGNLIALQALDLSGCNLRKLDCSTYKKLESLNLQCCKYLMEVSGLQVSESLTNLNASKCARLRTLGDLSNLKKLQELEIYYCFLLTEIKGLSKLESLELLDMGNCRSIERLPRMSSLRKLKKLVLTYCVKLREIEDLGGLESLEDLDLSWCESLESLPDLSKLRKLEKLDLSNCRKLREIEGLSGLVLLESLDLSSCKSLEQTLDISNLKNLKELRNGGLKYWTEIIQNGTP